MAKPAFILAIVLTALILVIPALLVQLIPQQSVEPHQPRSEASNLYSPQSPVINISVYRSEKGEIESVALEEYICGVVASEMPADFELEAIKAQALAARTYLIRRLVEKDFSDVPEGAIVTDTIVHQMYRNQDELKKLWGTDYEWKMNRIQQAVKETTGQVITYNGRPINATFFSTGNGYTENSEEYWGAEIPYLRSVQSPWDEESPRYTNRFTFSVSELEDKLDVRLTQAVSTNQPIARIVSRTTGNRVKEVQIADQTFTGKEVRERLGLDSSHFDIQLADGQVIIETVGYGHGVGLSQWGANGMAKEGYTAAEIVQHYYTDVEIRDYRNWIVRRE